MRNSKRILFAQICGLCILLTAFQGCVLVPFISSAKQTGILRADRERLLQEEVKKFQQVRFWGKPMQAAVFADRENRDAIQSFLRKHGKDEKVVESEIEFVDFAEDAYKAEVSAKIKYYRIPYYIVEERIESQDWTFSVASGWKIADVQVKEKL